MKYNDMKVKQLSLLLYGQDENVKYLESTQTLGWANY